MLEELLIRHGSPTLANLKAATLIRIPVFDGFDQEFNALKAVLNPKGLHLIVLHRNHESRLLYMYREQDLAKILAREDVQCFLSGYGYQDCSIEGALGFLSERITADDASGFPHEIGVFLDYPLTDVVAFILNKGKNCLCCGCWKAYTDQCGAMKTFARYAKCKEVYMRMFAAGVPMKRLAVRS